MLRVWVMAARPKTLWASVAPVLIGTAIAVSDGAFHGLSAVVCLLFAVLIQIATNFTNDYYDFKKGADREERLGPQRVTQAGLVKPQKMRQATRIAFALAVLVGLYLVWRGGWPMGVILVASVLAGFLYTAGPFPLGYHGLGEVFVLVFYGPVAVGATYYMQALTVHPYVLLVGLAPGLLSTGMIAINNLRDIDGDAEAGKCTLAVRFGRTFARGEILVCLFFAALLPVLLAPRPMMMLTLLVLPLASPVIQTVLTETNGPALNEAFSRAGRLLLVFTAAFLVGSFL